MRLFTAIELGAPVQRALGELVAELQRRAARQAPRARLTWVAPDRAHLTLRFIGEVDDERGAGLMTALRDPVAAAPFRVRWSGLGAFPGPGRPRVLWVGVAAGGSELASLEQIVSERLAALGLPREDRPFRPHLTLARVREAANLRVGSLFADLAAELGETVVDAITLFRSTLSPKGSTYTILQKTPLARGR